MSVWEVKEGKRGRDVVSDERGKGKDAGLMIDLILSVMLWMFRL